MRYYKYSKRDDDRIDGGVCVVLCGVVLYFVVDNEMMSLMMMLTL